jgi:hypothetical protein
MRQFKVSADHLAAFIHGLRLIDEKARELGVWRDDYTVRKSNGVTVWPPVKAEALRKFVEQKAKQIARAQ